MPQYLGIADQQKAHAGTQGRDPTALDSVDIGISSEYVRSTLSNAITDLEVRILTLYIRKISSCNFFLCVIIFSWTRIIHECFLFTYDLWHVQNKTEPITQVASHVIYHSCGNHRESKDVCHSSPGLFIARFPCMSLIMCIIIYITTKNILTIALSSELQPTDMVSCLQYCHYNINVTLILSCSSSKIYRYIRV